MTVETEQIVNDTVRAKKSIDRVLDILGIFTADWAHWLDVYNYMDGKFPNFIKKNVPIEALINPNISLILFINRKNEVIFGAYVDIENKKFINYPDGLKKYITSNLVHLQRTQVNDDIRGLIYLQSGIMIIAASAIIHEKKVPNGTLLVGRHFSQQLVDVLSDATSLSLSLFTLQQIAKDNTLITAFGNAILAKDGNYITVFNNSTMYGYTLLRDIYKNPIGMMRVSVKRAMFHTGVSTTKYFFVFFILFGLVLSILISYLLRIFILRRVEILNRQIQSISVKKNYTVRINSSGKDELSVLANEFNKMMIVIQSTYQKLANKIDQLTASEIKFKQKNLRLKDNIEQKQIAEKDASQLGIQLQLAAREAGMAELANSILQNINNILKQISISVRSLRTGWSSHDLSKIKEITDELNNNKDNLVNFLANDNVSKSLTKKLYYVTEEMKEIETKSKNELILLYEKINKIEEIIAMQKTLSIVPSKTIEKVFLPDIVEIAIKICTPSLESITLEKEFIVQPFIFTDQIKLIQLLIQLIKCARYSVLNINMPISLKKIILSIKYVEGNKAVDILVTDSGVGIPKDQLVKIFTPEFSSKNMNQGFNLHNCAIAANDLGGMLEAKSEGLGWGTTFILTLPLNLSEENSQE